MKDSYFIYLSKPDTFSFTKVAISNSQDTSEQISSNSIVYLSMANSGNNKSVTVKNVTLTSSDLQLFYFRNSQQDSSVALQFEISEITVTSCSFQDSIAIINIRNKNVVNQVGYSLSGIKFNNVSFPITGILMSFTHQVKDSLTMANSSFTQITNGQIVMIPNSENIGVMETKMTIDNLTATNISNLQNSFIEASVYSIVTITNSKFEYLTTLDYGSVAKSMDQSVNIIFVNCQFSKNLAVNGGVMFTKEKGSIE